MKLSYLLGTALFAGGCIAAAKPSPVEDLVPRATETGLVQEILDDIEHLATCAGCEALLLLLKGLAELGDETFSDTLTAVCDLSHAEDSDVCAGVAALEGPILAYDLRQMTIPSRTAQLLCTTLTGTCQWPAVEPYTVSFPKPKPNTTRPAPSGESPIHIVHFSDIHVDHGYESGANYNCTKPICCRLYTSADAPGNTSFPAGPFGEVECDAPLSLEESMFSAIQSLVPDRKFSIFTGDVVEHFVWGTTAAEVASDLSDASQRWDALGQIYPVAGNHDSQPFNNFPPSTLLGVDDISWVYSNYTQDWDKIGPASSTIEANSSSYTTTDPSTGLRLISLNTNFWYVLNFWLYEPTMSRDPSNVLSWLVTQLQAAEDSGQRVWIFGHIPPGVADVFHDASSYFDQVIQRYDATIAATFYGHTHYDQLQLAYSDYTAQSADNADMVAYIAPSLTPTSGHPAFRAYAVDPVTFGVLDYTQYFANMSTDTYQTSGPSWAPLYSAKALYGAALTPPVTDAAAELTPAFWHAVTEAFEADDDLFQTYVAYKSRGYDPVACTGDCKTQEICGIRAAQSQFNCVPVTPGVTTGLRRRDVGEVGEVGGKGGERATTAQGKSGLPGGDCEGGKLASVFRHVTAQGPRGEGLKVLARAAEAEMVRAAR